MKQQDLQLDWLRAFVAVVDAGSLSAAAAVVHRSQSAVSMQLKKLEQAAGSVLLLRTPREVALTAAGAELLPHARRVLAAHAAALETLHGAQIHGQLRLGVPEDYAQAYLGKVLRDYVGLYPAVEINLVCEQSTALIGKVENGELDLAVVSRDEPDRGEYLFDETMVWVGDSQHAAWLRDPLPIALYELGSRARTAVLDAVNAIQREWRVVYSSPSVAGQLTAVHSGMAVAVLTECSLPPGIQVLDMKHGLPRLPPLQVALIRSLHSQGSRACDVMQALILQILRR
ncbi:LysR family transcriptional regulator [Aquitalea sp. LB_tupeE]|nr:LysR family transcriptional regulator [Aquitalea sp. LB_tupeE]